MTDEREELAWKLLLAVNPQINPNRSPRWVNTAARDHWLALADAALANARGSAILKWQDEWRDMQAQRDRYIQVWTEAFKARDAALAEVARLRVLLDEANKTVRVLREDDAIDVAEHEALQAEVARLREALEIADAACRTYWGWEYGRPGEPDDCDAPNSSLLVAWRKNYEARAAFAKEPDHD